MTKTSVAIEETKKRKSQTDKGKAQASKPSNPPPKAATRKPKGKGKAVEQEESEESERELSETESEEERAPKGKGKEISKGKGRAKAQAQPKVTYAQYMKRFEEISFIATRYPDPVFLEQAGLVDVKTIFKNMGLEKFLSLAFDTYVDLTKEFIATLSARENKPRENEWDDVAFIEFTIGRKKYKMTYEEIGSIYGLATGLHLTLEKASSEPALLWQTIGVGAFKKGVTKATNIRHPSIRYVHKVLANTLYARKETGTIAESEMRFLLVGLSPFLCHLRNGGGLRSNKHHVSMVGIFVHYLLYIQDWVMTSSDKSPQLSMGGLLTPLFMAKGIELSGKRLELTRIDKYYLGRTKYLAGSIGNMFAYRFQASPSEQRKILLPNPELTSLEIKENIAFNHGEEHMYNMRRDGNLEKLHTPRNKSSHQEIAGPSGDAPSLPPPPSSPVYGSARYHFEPYDEPIQQPALRKAHEHIHLLQRFIKWQGRSLRKVVGQVKSLTSEVKSLKGRLSGAGCSNPQPDEVVDSVAEQAPFEEGHIEENTEAPMEEDVQERHSFHGVPSSQMDIGEPHRASSYERRQRRKRRAPRSPTPPVASSSNDSYSFSSTSWY